MNKKNITSVLELKHITIDLLEDFKKIKNLAEGVETKNTRGDLSSADLKTFWKDIKKIYLDIEKEYIEWKEIVEIENEYREWKENSRAKLAVIYTGAKSGEISKTSDASK